MKADDLMLALASHFDAQVAVDNVEASNDAIHISHVRMAKTVDGEDILLLVLENHTVEIDTADEYEEQG